MIWLALAAVVVLAVAVWFLRGVGRVLEESERLRRIREEADD